MSESGFVRDHRTEQVDTALDAVYMQVRHIGKVKIRPCVCAIAAYRPPSNWFSQDWGYHKRRPIVHVVEDEY